MYENKGSMAHPFNHTDPQWWALWHWPQLGVKRESEKERNVTEQPSVWDSQGKKERKRKYQQSALHDFFQTRDDPQPGTYQKSNLCITPQSKKINAGALQCYSQKCSVWASNV